MTNISILAGNVGADPETRTTQSGKSITNFSLATSRPKRDSDGKILKDAEGRTVEDTEWHRITCFNGLAKTVAQYVAKGQKVMVEGAIHYSTWTDKDDIKRYSAEIVAEKVNFLSKGKGAGRNDVGDDDIPY